MVLCVRQALALVQRLGVELSHSSDSRRRNAKRLVIQSKPNNTCPGLVLGIAGHFSFALGKKSGG